MANPLAPRRPGGIQQAELDDILARHLATKAEKTIAAYGSDLRAFAKFRGEPDMNTAVARFLACNRGDAKRIILEWREWMVHKGCAGQTINRRLCAIRKVVKIQDPGWTLDVEGVPVTPLRDTRGPGIAVIRELFAAADADETILGYRDVAILQWLFYLGLRRIEVVRLEVGDFFPGPEAIAMVQRKTKRDKIQLPVDPRPAKAAKRWLHACGMPRSGPLFFGTTGRGNFGSRSQLNPATINRIVRSRAIQAGYEGGRLPDPDGRPITPHGFRHTAGTQIVKAGGSLIQAQEFLGHKNPQTTQIYFDNVGEATREAQALLPTL